jgi:hypothetical protein
MKKDLTLAELLPVFALVLGNSSKILKNQVLILEKILDQDREEILSDLTDDILSFSKDALECLCSHFGIEYPDNDGELFDILSSLSLN